ncbi:hypothetical protein GQ53DRAFT_262620 [Thozetella sp. PMI_491]|nr:hypothetical protein GQ53DRAFT_262620 [Thozetella sp. PMI_491]
MTTNPGSSASGSNFKLAPGTFYTPGLTPTVDMDLDTPPISDFTSKMRDRQSRGKNPYAIDDSSDVDEEMEWRAKQPNLQGEARNINAPRDGDFAAVERRQKAIAYLDNPELLMMYAQSTGDSIPAARLHFMKMMCGYDEETLADTKKVPVKSLQQHQQKQQRRHQERDVDKRRGGDRAAGR